MAPHISVSSLPDISQPEMNFYDTSFFKDNPLRALPSPEHVRQQVPGRRSGAVKYEDLGLVVKFNPELSFEEAQTMRAIKSAFPQGEVSVPEVFGWRSYGEHQFIYMSFVEGETLYDLWDSLAETDKELICVELRNIISSLQQITRDPTEGVICELNVTFP